MTFTSGDMAESLGTSSVLKYTSPAWPTRLGGISIFICVLLVFSFSTNVSFVFPLVSFLFMLVGIFFSAEISVLADRSSRLLIVTKRRIIGSTNISYQFDDIAFLCQNITTSTNQKGEKYEKTKYTLGLNSQTGTFSGYYRGRKPVPLPIPTSVLTIFSGTMRNIQEYTRARAISEFIGVPLYVNGGLNDSIVNTAEVIPEYIKDIQSLPDVFAQAKKENERVAREVLGDKYPS